MQRHFCKIVIAASAKLVDMARVLGVLGGNDMDAELLGQWLATAEVILAADSGADRVLEALHEPHVVVGDMDSISEAGLARTRDLRRMEGQDDSDCDKLLSLADSLGHRSITLACIEGDRLDHTIAALWSGLNSGLDVRVALRQGIAYLMKGPASLSLPTGDGRLFSVIPLTDCQNVTIHNAVWPLENVALGLGAMVSLSNRTLAGELSVHVGSGAAMLFVAMEVHEMPAWDEVDREG